MLYSQKSFLWLGAESNISVEFYRYFPTNDSSFRMTFQTFSLWDLQIIWLKLYRALISILAIIDVLQLRNFFSKVHYDINFTVISFNNPILVLGPTPTPIGSAPVSCETRGNPG